MLLHAYEHIQRDLVIFLSQQMTCPKDILWLWSLSTPHSILPSASWTVHLPLEASLLWETAMWLQDPPALHHLIYIPNAIARHDTQGVMAKTAQDLFYSIVLEIGGIFYTSLLSLNNSIRHCLGNKILLN